MGILPWADAKHDRKRCELGFLFYVVGDSVVLLTTGMAK